MKPGTCVTFSTLWRPLQMFGGTATRPPLTNSRETRVAQQNIQKSHLDPYTKTLPGAGYFDLDLHWPCNLRRSSYRIDQVHFTTVPREKLAELIIKML